MSPEHDRPQSKHASVAIFAGAAALVFLAVVSGCSSSHSSAGSSTTGNKSATIHEVTARITTGADTGIFTPVIVSLVPAVVTVGTVTIVVKNLDRRFSHQLLVDGVSSAWVNAGGGRAVMKVRFTKAATYTIDANVTAAETGGSVLLKVIK